MLMLNDCEHKNLIETAHGNFCLNCGHLNNKRLPDRKPSQIAEEPIGKFMNIEINHQPPQKHAKAKIEKASLKIKVKAA